MISTTVSFGYIDAVWRLIPIRGLSESASRRDVDAEDDAPGRRPGARRPSRISTVVVLPAPFGPSRPNTSPARDVEVDAVDRPRCRRSA